MEIASADGERGRGTPSRGPHTIPALLLPDASQGSWSLLQLAGARLIAPPGNPATPQRLVWVSGTGWAGQVLRVAIDPETLLIRRLEDDGLGERRPYQTEYEPDATSSVLREELLGGDPGRL